MTGSLFTKTKRQIKAQLMISLLANSLVVLDGVIIFFLKKSVKMANDFYDFLEAGCGEIPNHIKNALE